jgi:hypothetical protein
MIYLFSKRRKKEKHFVSNIQSFLDYEHLLPPHNDPPHDQTDHGTHIMSQILVDVDHTEVSHTLGGSGK